MTGNPVPTVPPWVPEPARRYLFHTVAGHPIRELARRSGCHASTVLRQIRRIEMRRDDPLVDAALSTLAKAHFPTAHPPKKEPAAMPMTLSSEPVSPPQMPEAAALEREARRVLSCLSEAGAVLAVAEQMEKAVVVRGEGARTAVVDTPIAQMMALKDWIACATPGRISRYHITGAGRAELRRLLAEEENRARYDKDSGLSEMQAPYGGSDDPDSATARRRRRSRYSRGESPLALLARRKDRDGLPFLDDGLVRAGERLREDFELAQLGPRVGQSWDRFLTGPAGRAGARPGGDPVPARGGQAWDRVARALADLGPGLSDVALRCCCYLEGLEEAERRMGWSARSGKIVLRIALQRLKAHYDRQAEGNSLIG
ncbi:DUF6456 domain-containing protein [Pseudodonghicola flavimaris]|uniref:DUF6456 domain-containing protein n=1 Tax=Pseudodonghicola flavimaris TaxID=3050036 RepID=A0ABT7F6V5_9RHOB|nr:DUF6456 domain-containing protein [Pseudodonghicola flavimaris]MDK3020341.1 DUF6456 domain-containing protein [Pseudodonghicola flavimaris]